MDGIGEGIIRIQEINAYPSIHDIGISLDIQLLKGAVQMYTSESPALQVLYDRIDKGLLEGQIDIIGIEIQG